jgi:signal transduction histidine kinase
MLDRLDQSARQALKEMRLLLYEMRLAPLENLRLVETLQNRLDAVEKRAGIDASVNVEEPALWPLKWEAEMYCIAMEALNNSLKHANANRVRVNLRGNAGWVEMSIVDNGKGFIDQNTQKTGIGLHSMRERAERLGGELQVVSGQDSGTTIFLRVGKPLAIENEEAGFDSNTDRG